jgi:hypothetical protein
VDIKTTLVLLVLFGTAFPRGSIRAAPPALVATALGTPAGPGAGQPALTAAGDGSLWLTWLEPAAAGSMALRCSPFDPARSLWRPAVTVARGDGFARGPGDLPALAVTAAGQAAVAWTVLTATGQGQRVMLSQSEDGGRSWSPPALLSRESTDCASPALATLADGRLVAVWLDRRARSSNDRGMGLYVRLLGLEAAPDRLLDPEAVEGSQPVLTALLDGGLLVAYSGRHPGSTPHPRVLRWHRRQWGEPHEIDSEADDGGDAPNGGPRIAGDGGRVGAVWTAGGGAGRRLLVSASPDAGIRFQMPVTVGAGDNVPSRPALALLHDGALLVTWAESDPAGEGQRLRLGRFSPDLRPLPAPITLAPAGPLLSLPQIGLVRDYAGNGATAVALVVFGRGGPQPGLGVIKVTIPEGELLAAANDDCRCSPTPAQLAGYSIRGTITAVQAPAGSLTLDLDAAPGVMEAGPQVFQASAGTLAAARTGRQCLARIERKASGWRLFDLRLLEEPR